MARRWHRWLPAAAVGVLIAGGAGLTAQAGSPDLPQKSAEDVLTMVAEHSVEAFSGEFETSTEFGLPDLSALDGVFGSQHRGGMPAPDLGDDGPPDDAADAGDDAAGPGVAEALELLTGEHTGRVYVDGAEHRARFQLLDDMAEQNVVRTENEVWFYDSEQNAATHLSLPEPGDQACLHGEGSRGPRPAPDDERPAGPARTPDEVATELLEALEPSTDITVGEDHRVAGRAAYTLVLAPRSEHTLVQDVALAVDGETGFPLGVTVNARGQDEPALHVQYTDITFETPDASLFDFTPPDGARVEQIETPPCPEPPEDGERPGRDTGTTAGPGAGHDGPPGWARDREVIGAGWDAVVVLPSAGELEGLRNDPLLQELTQDTGDGQLLSTALLSVLITDDGQVLIGAVTPEYLQSLAVS